MSNEITITYVTSDGKPFSDKADAFNHQARINLKKIFSTNWAPSDPQQLNKINTIVELIMENKIGIKNTLNSYCPIDPSDEFDSEE